MWGQIEHNQQNAAEELTLLTRSSMTEILTVIFAEFKRQNLHNKSTLMLQILHGKKDVRCNSRCHVQFVLNSPRNIPQT